MEASAKSAGRTATVGSRWHLRALALIQSLVILGPALGPGLVIRYDMAWSPDPRWTPFVLGIDTPAPRAVPSDAVAVLLGSLIGPQFTQSLILVGILVGIGLGAGNLARSLDDSIGSGAQAIAMVAAVWNPYVHDRLVLGQWTILLGLALLPWTLRAAVHVVAGQRDVGGLLGLIVLAGAGGANTLVVAVVPAVVLLVLETTRRRTRWRTVASVMGVAAGMSAVWAIPALVAGASSSGVGAQVFAPVADTPLGVLGSLLSGGGVWNTAAHASSRQVLVVALVTAVLWVLGVGGFVARARRIDEAGLIAAIGVATLLVLLSIVPATAEAWSWIVTAVPGGGLLRDSHKLMAAWVIAGAVGLALLTAYLRRVETVHAPVTVLLALMPVGLSPLLIWGAGGALSPVHVPDSYRQSVDRLNELPAGDVALLPWNQYRRYAWNERRVSLTLGPRMVDRIVVHDDRLPLRSGIVPGESARAAQVSGALDAGTDLSTAFEDVGVRYVALERDSMGGQTDDAARLEALEGTIVIDTADLLVVDLGPPGPGEAPATGAVLAGWILTFGVAAGVGLVGTFRRVRRDRL